MRLFLVLLLFICQNGHSFVPDYKLNGLMRSYPKASLLTANLGLSEELWENRNKANYLYGFMRESLILQSSFVVNSVKAQLDLYPISILGLYAGGGVTTRNYSKLPTFSCDTIECEGKTQKKYIGTRWALKKGDYFATGDHKKEWLTNNTSRSFFAEEQSSLVAKSPKDQLTQHVLFAGKDISDTLSLGPLIMISKLEELSTSSMMETITLRYKKNHWSLLIGSGLFHSREEDNHFTVWGILGFDGPKGLLLF